MKLIKIGKIVNTHGIKGELRLLSKFPYKDKVFIKNMPIYINKEEKEIINTYRKHKNFDMITLDGYTNINEVLKLRAEACLESLPTQLAKNYKKFQINLNK